MPPDRREPRRRPQADHPIRQPPQRLRLEGEHLVEGLGQVEEECAARLLEGVATGVDGMGRGSEEVPLAEAAPQRMA